MELKAHVRKTVKGEEEIQTRAHKLDHSLRFVLILVDGHSTVEQVIAKAEGRPEVLESLARLQAEGYIVPDGGAGTASGGSDVAAVKAELIRIARELLGPEAGRVVSKLEAAPDTREALLEATGQCRKMVRLTIDERKAEQLMARCSALLDAL